MSDEVVVTGWRPTAALGRALVLAAIGVVGGMLLGDPVLVVLAAPFTVLGALALAHRPRQEPRAATRLDHVSLHEGVGTTSRLTLRGADDVEHVTRVAAQHRHVAGRPAGGRVGALHRPAEDPPVLELSPRRWGRRLLGEEKVDLVSRWAGYRWGPHIVGGAQLRVLPATPAYDSRAEAPHPVGLVGAHRSQRAGSGTELAGIRPFLPGDRLRRVNWRVSLRTRDLHVVSTRAEEDSAVLLVVDALADHGVSGGVDGAPSSLDLGVRAASALAEHHVHTGDRVGLRVIGRGREHVGYGTGSRHLRRLQHTLAMLRVGDPGTRAEGAPLRVTGGTVVVVLSPMLAGSVGTTAATLTRRGVPVLVIDTLPPDVRPAVPEGTDPQVAALAWRMRSLERTLVLQRLAALGCPVVPWRGAGTVDDVLRRLARRAQLPRVAAP